ncbi:hypothetical protein [Bernardetia sp.]|uniref:hypothetical protein n=1 Tax=Bernardetia sp. TaxID=1937974 RepID=UPI0025B95723|nr:hypothetical protein [Bernardetia sp.]
MKNLLYAFLSLFLVGCNSESNVRTPKREKSKLVVEYRTLSNVPYPQERSCIEKLASYHEPMVGFRCLFPKDISEFGLNTTYQEDSYYINRSPLNKFVSNEDENYKVYVKDFDYMVSLVVFEDKKTRNRYFTITGKAKGIFWINNAYWIVGNGCHMGCSMTIERIKNPKVLRQTNEQNLDSLNNQLHRLSYEEKMKIVEQDEVIFSGDSFEKNLSGFIPYQNSMVLVFEKYKSNKYYFIQVNEDKSVENIDSLINGKFNTRDFMNDRMVTILPKKQNLIPFCQTIFKIQNDTLFVYSLE